MRKAAGKKNLSLVYSMREVHGKSREAKGMRSISLMSSCLFSPCLAISPWMMDWGNDYIAIVTCMLSQNSDKRQKGEKGERDGWCRSMQVREASIPSEFMCSRSRSKEPLGSAPDDRGSRQWWASRDRRVVSPSLSPPCHQNNNNNCSRLTGYVAAVCQLIRDDGCLIISCCSHILDPVLVIEPIKWFSCPESLVIIILFLFPIPGHLCRITSHAWY